MAFLSRRAAIAFFFGLLAWGVGPASAQQPDVTGVWQQMDSDTGKVGSYVYIHAVHGVYEGDIVKLFLKPGDNPNPICAGCKGDQKGHPFLGLRLMYGLKKDGLTYSGGTIVDPRDGSEYNVELTLSEDGETLTVRGFIGLSIFGQSLEWKRLDNPDPQLLKVLDTAAKPDKKALKKADQKKPERKPAPPVTNE
jgi:uncharacterized protein (DUF2147 family)